MATNITARLASWSINKVTGPTGKVTKKAIREALHTDPGSLEFDAVPTIGNPRGGYFFTREVGPATIELRFNDDRDVAIVEVHPSGSAVVR